MSNLFRPYFGYQEGEVLFEDVVRSILKLNSEMLSEQHVKHQPVYGFLQKQNLSELKQQWLYGEHLTNEAKEKICGLVNFRGTHYIEIPIYNLMLLHREQYNLLGITLRKATETDVKHYDKEFKGVGLSTSDVHSFACVQVGGDNNISTSKAIAKVRHCFDIIRAFCFPFGKDSEAYNTGIFGDIPMRSSLPIIIDQSQYPFKTNQRNQQIELENHILPKLTDKQWGLIDAICKKKMTTEMQTKLLDSIHWLGEATKPDTEKAKFVKICLALETMLGSESNIKDLKAQGLTVMLAERAAFIMGKGYRKMRYIDKKIHDYYGIRSAIIHGQKIKVKDSDLEEFGLLIRELAVSLLERLSGTNQDLVNVDDFAEWAKDLKYKYVHN